MNLPHLEFKLWEVWEVSVVMIANAITLQFLSWQIIYPKVKKEDLLIINSLPQLSNVNFIYIILWIFYRSKVKTTKKHYWWLKAGQLGKILQKELSDIKKPFVVTLKMEVTFVLWFFRVRFLWHHVTSDNANWLHIVWKLLYSLII